MGATRINPRGLGAALLLRHGQVRGAGRTVARSPARFGTPWLALALTGEVLLALVDAFSGDKIVFTTAFVLAPVALAISRRSREVAIAAVVAWVLAAASGFWDHYAGSSDHLVRLVIVAAGGALAVMAARAGERARQLRAAADTERRRMAVLAAVGRLSGAERVEEAVEGLGEALVPAVADVCWVDLCEEDGSARRLLTRAGTPDREEVEAWLSTREIVAGEARHAALEHDRGRLVEVAAVEAERLALTSAAIVPLRSADRTIGVLGSAAAGGRTYDPNDVAFFEILAGRVALVLANAQLVTDLRSTQARLDGILGSLAEAVTVHDERGKTVYANDAAVRLLGRASAEDVTAAEPGELAARFAITKEDGTPVAVEELPGRRLVAGEDAPALLTRSVDRETGHAYWLLTKATALHDRGRMFAVNIIEDVTEAKDAELRQRFLAQAGQLLASSLDYEETLRRVAQLAVPSLADWCAVDLPDEHGRIQLVAVAHVDPAKVEMAHELRRRYPPDHDAPNGVPHVLAGGPPELYREIPDELIAAAIRDPEELAAVRELGMRSVMIVPMRAGDATFGAITLVSAESGRVFGDDDFAFAQDLALRAATAVQNARLYHEQARVAHTLQASLLPERLPDVPGWRSDATYQAGERGIEVGGDFYDVVPAARGHLVFLGDVTGKGVEAAALTSLVRHSARTAARFDPRPAAVLGLLNDILLQQPWVAPVTLVCSLIEDAGEAARMTVAAAGHPLPLLRRGGAVSEVGRHGVLLGAVRDVGFEQDTIAIEPGDTIVLYTDGVTDTPGRGERFGPERLAAIVAAAPPEPAEVRRRIEQALGVFQVGTSADDRAMLVLRFTGERDDAAPERPSVGSAAA